MPARRSRADCGAGPHLRAHRSSLDRRRSSPCAPHSVPPAPPPVTRAATAPTRPEHFAFRLDAKETRHASHHGDEGTAIRPRLAQNWRLCGADPLSYRDVLRPVGVARQSRHAGRMGGVADDGGESVALDAAVRDFGRGVARAAGQACHTGRLCRQPFNAAGGASAGRDGAVRRSSSLVRTAGSRGI